MNAPIIISLAIDESSSAIFPLCIRAEYNASARSTFEKVFTIVSIPYAESLFGAILCSSPVAILRPHGVAWGYSYINIPIVEYVLMTTSRKLFKGVHAGIEVWRSNRANAKSLLS